MGTIIFCSLGFPCLVLSVEPGAAPSGQEGEAESVDAVYIPKDLEDCFTELSKIMAPENLERFKTGDENTVVGGAHRGLGMWLRNNWGLWSGSRLAVYFKQIGLTHPDDMSTIILRSYHRRLNGKDIQLEQQIDYYQDYWKKVKERESAKGVS